MSARPRIVFAYRFGVLGGVSAQLLNRYPAFSEHYDIAILFELDYGMVARFPDGVARVTASAQEKVDALEELQPDVLLVVDSPLFIEAWHDAGAPGKLIVEVHTTTRNQAYLAELRADHEISAFATVSDYMVESLRADGLDAIAPISVVPNCLDEPWFSDVAAQELPAPPLLWVGKLDLHKRWRAALDLMDDVAPRLKRAPVPILIGGYTAAASEMQALLKRIYASPILSDAQWWPQVDYPLMPAIYRSTAEAGGGLVMTTRNESFGMAAAEAIVMGCPVVAPRVGALPELLPDEALYEPDDWVDAAAKTALMLEDAAYRKQLLVHRDEVLELVRPASALGAFRELLAGVLDQTAASA